MVTIISDKGILYIEPSADVSKRPVIDNLTKKMTAALRQGTAGERYRGHHTCACGQQSTNTDYTLPSGETTNSLCVHYLAWHRDDVPPEQLAKVKKLDCGKAEPSDAELHSPHEPPFGPPTPRPKVTR